MSFRQQTKSGLFLLELLLNLLLFCLLCGCALLFFIKSHRLSEDATILHNAVQITTSLAGIYETNENGLDVIEHLYPLATTQGNKVTIYYDRFFHSCSTEEALYHVVISPTQDKGNHIHIEFYNTWKELYYSITSCYYTPETLKEVVTK